MSKRNKTFAETLLKGAREAAAIARGEARPARVTRRSLSTGAAQIPAPPKYSPARIRKLREHLNMSQPVFARSLNASDATVKAWEQGKRTPDGTSLRLLELAEMAPEVFADIVGVGESMNASAARQRRKSRKVHST
jgi:DNA-binding transcriptional regulator YiaG